uniref:Ground-like domain-containing protein n=1 Tax=Elaeophora elaphi TaxID=1147741 RepID=A0A0R3RGQ5_9BILA
MAISIMLIVFVIIFPPSKSLAPFLRPLGSQDLTFLKDEDGEQSGIRHTLLEKLNKFSSGNSQELVMFRPNNMYHDYSPIIDEKHQNEPIFEDQYHTTKGQTTSMTSEVANMLEMNSKIPQKSTDILNEWKQIREKRLRFYKAFRKIQNLNHRNHRSFMNGNGNVDGTNKTLVLNHRREKNKESSTDPVRFIFTNITYNDWETFITDYSKAMPQYNRRHATLSEYDDIDNMSNQFLKANESIISSPSGYIPQFRLITILYSIFDSQLYFRKMQSSGVTRNPLDYQQLITNLNPTHEMVSSKAEAVERLPPPPNPKSTEASVHTVKVYPPSQQPFSTDYQNKDLYQNNAPNNGNYQKFDDRYGERADFQQQSISQLMSNDYNIDTTYTPEANPDCIADPCEINNANPFGFTEDERCNSPRLKQIILQNIVERDAETSKQAIYNVCEAEMEVPCNVICGTGFYSYIARATQFCLISAVDITCYAFLPACDFDSTLIQKRWTKKHRTKV